MAREQTQLFHQNVKAEMEEMLAIELPHVENIGFTTEEWQSKSVKNLFIAINPLCQPKISVVEICRGMSINRGLHTK